MAVKTASNMQRRRDELAIACVSIVTAVNAFGGARYGQRGADRTTGETTAGRDFRRSGRCDSPAATEMSWQS